MTIQPKPSVTIEDVARTAGVSRAAVSKVIRDAYGVSDEMRAKVEAAIAELGYRPRVSARGLRGATYTLGIEIPTVANTFFTKIILGASAALEDTRYQLIIAPAGPHHDGGPQTIEMLVDRQVDGLLAISPAVQPEWLERLAQQIPLVMLGRHDASIYYDTIVNDDLQGARLAVDHLVSLGHRDIAHVTIDPYAENHVPTAPHAVRARGYRAAMAAAGLAEHTNVIYVNHQELSWQPIFRQLLALPNRPTAVFAGHDDIALGLLEGTAEHGLDGTELSIIGYDDTPIAAHPLVSLTSVNQSGTRMGEIVVRLLLERIAGRTEAVHEVITPRLMIRNTTRPPTNGRP